MIRFNMMGAARDVVQANVRVRGDFRRRSGGSEGREFGAAVVELCKRSRKLGEKLLYISNKNDDVSLGRALEIARRLSVCHALLSIFTKTLV